MYKVIWLHRFRKDADPVAVRDWWLNHHGPMALRAKGLRRYVQNHWIEPIEGVNELAFDGHVDAWFDSRDAYLETMASPEWQALVDDGPGGFDPDTLMPNMIAGAVNEHIMRWDALPDRRTYRASGPIPER